ncbi:MAG: hypothetical protein UHN47_03810 [Lachnospiraceae bacterium]|nr:hypothetical protein [Lachnospiraceae bacterium]
MVELPKEVVEEIKDYCNAHPQCVYCAFSDEKSERGCKLHSSLGFPCEWELE